tara:strand:- start:353 stop:721 length:369 start_codon:yes stop_codon:yes gene_type:complete
MKKIMIYYAVIIVIFAMSGCLATQYGIREAKSVGVRFTSEPDYLKYYVISIPDNEKLGGSFEPLKKEEKLLNFISRKSQGFADNVWDDLRPGEWVIMIDCGAYFTRNRVVFKDGLDVRLRCP